MKHQEYDSPLELVVSNITTQMAKSVDGMCWQAVQRAGINVDKDKLLAALNQDSERYRKAYKNGYDTGYEKRDDEIVRCRDCKHFNDMKCSYPERGTCDLWHMLHWGDWFCADGERKEDGDVE